MDAAEVSALGRLVETGTIKAGIKNEHLIRRFSTAQWIALGTRKSEWVVIPFAGDAIAARLSSLLPDWENDFQFLRTLGLDPYNPSDIEVLATLRRHTGIASMINRRNWNAAAGLGPKHKAKLPPQCELTKDWGLRFRPNKGLVGVVSGKVMDFSALAAMLTECFIPERGWRNLEGFSGTLPEVIVTCENLGAYIDFPANDSLMIVYSPGADIEPTTNLINMLPDALWIHFGDIDPDGIAIATNISSATGRDLKFFIPSFVSDYLPGRPVETPWDSIPENPIFATLKKKKRRIFQEVFMLDDRLHQDFVNSGDLKA